MMVMDKIRADWKAARLARETQKATLLSTLVGAVQSKEKQFNPERHLTDEEVVAQVKKLIDGAQETIGYLKNHSVERAEDLEKSQREITWLSEYMPKQLSEGEIEAFLQAKIGEGVSGMAGLMAALKAAHAGAYDGRVASAVAKRLS